MNRTVRRAAALCVALLVLPVAASAQEDRPEAQPRDISDTCTGQDGDPTGFDDVPDTGGVHAPRIRCIGPEGYAIAQGVEEGTYGASQQVTGSQIATFLVRTFREAGLLAADDTSTSCGGGSLAGFVGVLVDDGVMSSCDVAVPARRSEMAVWTVNALEVYAGVDAPDAPDYFADDEDEPAATQAAADTLADLGVVLGESRGVFAPRERLSRGEMATFLARSFDATLDRDRGACAERDPVEEQVVATNFDYDRTTITGVCAGDTITLDVQEGSHSFTSDTLDTGIFGASEGPRSVLVHGGARTFEFFCQLHPQQMRGTVTVVG